MRRSEAKTKRLSALCQHCSEHHTTPCLLPNSIPHTAQLTIRGEAVLLAMPAHVTEQYFPAPRSSILLAVNSLPNMNGLPHCTHGLVRRNSVAALLQTREQ